MKFCCERFKSRWELSKESGINIRVVKMDENSIIDKSIPIRIFLTMGYSGSVHDAVIMPIRYCPFCGVDLFKYYNKEMYINE